MSKRGALHTAFTLFRRKMLFPAALFSFILPFTFLTFLIFLSYVPLAAADHDATIALSALDQFETTTQQVDIEVNNFGSEDVISRLIASSPLGTVVGTVSYGGWQSSISNTNSGATIVWFDGTVETNVIAAIFQFLTKAGKVEEDTAAQLTLISEDTAGFTEEHTFTWTIRNDGTGPELIPIAPQDGSFLLEKSTPLLLSANSSDNETEVANVTFDWANCTNSTVSTNNSNSTNSTNGALSGSVLLNSNDEERYDGEVDFSAFKNEETICFAFTALSNGGESTLSEGTIVIDGESPGVTSISPSHAATMNSQTVFRFFPTDNLAEEVSCLLVVDGEEVSSETFTTGVISELAAADAPEGSHNWFVQCVDHVGLIGQSSARSYFLDKTAPTITIDHAQNAVLKEGTPLTIISDDNYLLALTQITINGNTTNSTNKTTITTNGLPEGEHTIQIHAVDGAGNSADLLYAYFIDKSAPVINIQSPEHGDSIDVFAHFLFTAIDTYDPIVDCTLFINGIANVTVNATNETQNLSAALSPGDYTWSLDCIDDADNSISTVVRSLKVLDTSGPAISIEPLDLFVRGASIPLSAIITDFSNVSNVSMNTTYPNGTAVVLPFSVNGDEYAADLSTDVSNPLGIYTLTIRATDSNGYQSVVSEEFEITYGYALSLTATPSATTPGTTIQLTGTVLLDDGSKPDDAKINLLLPSGNATVNATNSSFAYFLSAPIDGTYQVIASVVAPNGITFKGSTTISTATPSNGGSGGSDGSSGGSSGGLRGFGSSNGGGSSGGSSGSVSGGSTSGQSSGQGSSGGSSDSSSGSDGSDSNNGVESSSDSDSPSSGPQTGDSSSGDSSSDRSNSLSPGVGQAIGLFNLDLLKEHRMAWTLGVLAVLLGVLFILGMKGHFHQSKKVEKDEWGSYFERNRR